MAETVEFPSNGSTASGYLVTPPSGSGPGVLVVQEWWGLDPGIQQTADRIAGGGFVALVPDLYHGELAAHDEMDEASRLMQSLPPDRAGRDMSAAVDFLASHSGPRCWRFFIPSWTDAHPGAGDELVRRPSSGRPRHLVGRDHPVVIGHDVAARDRDAAPDARRRLRRAEDRDRRAVCGVEGLETRLVDVVHDPLASATLPPFIGRPVNGWLHFSSNVRES